METLNLLPENDRDLLLAQQIGQSLESQKGTAGIQDDLIGLLHDFKQQEVNEILAYPSSSDIWEYIEEQTQKSEKVKARIIPFYQNPAVLRWAVAATVLIASFTGLFLYNQAQPVLIAQSGSQMEVVNLEDGSVITLRPYSSLFELASKDSRSYKLEGEGFFDVAKDPSNIFNVSTDLGVVTVLGTRFNLSTWGNSTIVYLEEGSIRFEDESNNSTELIPGQSAQISEGKLSVPSTANPDLYTDWLNNQLSLENTSIESAVSELEQHFNITLDITQIENPLELLGGTIILDEADNTLSDLGVILSGTFRKTGERTYRFIPLN